VKKEIKFLIGLVVVGMTIYNSIYFRPLDEKLAEEKEVVFDAKRFVDRIWQQDLLMAYDSATDITILLDRLKRDPRLTFEREAQALGIGNIGYFKVKGEGSVLSVNENNVLLQVGNQTVEIETEFIFGNVVRAASGLIQINDYDETSDFNRISESINDKIRSEVIPDFRARVQKGNNIQFKGALELNKAHLSLHQPEVIPVAIQLIP